MVALLLLVNAASTLAMVGLIWFVQVVHYPLMGQVGTPQFEVYEARHVQATSFVVVPFMLCELVTAGLLCGLGGVLVPSGEAALGLVLLLGVWASTWALQVPMHEVLRARFDASAHSRLVKTNWIRTVLWSVRGLLVLFWLARGLA